MMKVEVKNVQSVFDRLRKVVDDNFDGIYHDKVNERFSLLVNTTPQYSGDMASNWEISLDGSAIYLPWELKGQSVSQKDIVHMGDPLAVNYAIEQSLNVQYTYKDNIYFANATPLTFGDTTVTGFGTTYAVRPENLIDGRVAMISYLISRFPQ